MATQTTGRTIDLRDGRVPSSSASPATSSSASSSLPARPAVTGRQRAGGWVDALLGGPLPARLARWDTPLLTYSVLQGVVLLLVGIGAVMVLSSSSVESISADGSPFTYGLKQAQFAVIGVVALLVVARLPPRFWRAVAPVVLVLAVALEALALVPGLGHDVGGNQNWVRIGGFSGQPSEFGKVALALWSATVLAGRQKVLDRPLGWGLQLALGVVPLVGIVVLGHDLGTAMVMGLVVVAAIFAAGVPLRWLALLFALAGAGVAGLAVSSQNRMDRIASFLAGGDADKLGTGWQSVHGLYALASGGLTGLGLGGSRQKWDWLPEAHNDFIFAIIGEELGLVGTLVVVGLFVVFGWCCARVVRRSSDVFVVVLVSAVMAWVLGQAAVNIAVVLGMLPVIGLPLPLISYGGSALLATLGGIGLVLACARHSPGAQASLRARPGLVRRSLAVVSRRGGGR